MTILSLGGLSYPDYLLYVGLPMSAVTLLAGWVMAGRIQKMTEGKLRYDVDLAEKPQEDLSAAQQRRRKLSALAFAATIIVMAIVGVVIKAGFSFAIIVMLLVALMTGFGRRPATDADPSGPVSRLRPSGVDVYSLLAVQPDP